MRQAGAVMLIVSAAVLIGPAVAADPAAPAVAMVSTEQTLIPVPPTGPSPAPADAAIAAQRDWWQAFGDGDLATLERLSAPDLTVTLAAGRALDRVAAFEQSKAFIGGAATQFTWGHETVRYPDPETAIVASRTTEILSGKPVLFRMMTVLARNAGAWRVVATQTTRETVWSPRVPATVSGDFKSFEGRYRGLKGGFVTARATPDGLLMLDPRGHATTFEPIGPALFETRPDPKANDAVRIAFTRGADGRLASMLRMSTVFVVAYPYAGPEPAQPELPRKE